MNTYPLTLAYDLNRRLLSSADAFGFGTINSLDPVGRVTATTNRHGDTVATSFTPWGRVLDLTAPSGESSLHTLDADGLVQATTNPLDQTTQLAHDPLERPAIITNPLGHTTGHVYDPAGNRIAFTNANGHQWQWQHSPTNRVASLTSPLGRTWSYTYDERDLPESVTRPSGEEVAMDYWPDGQLKSLTDGEGTIDFTYDPKGRLHTVTEGSDVITREYDSLDRLTSFTDAAGNEIGYVYDGGNNLTELIYPDGKTVTYAYDNAGRVVSVTDWASRMTTLSYDANSRLSGMVFPNGTQRIITYDFAGRAAGIRDEVVATGEVISEVSHSFDVLDRIRKEVVTPEPDPFAVNPAIMAYDEDDRLTAWNGQTTTSDADGNLTSGPVQGVLSSLEYDKRNRLTNTGGVNYTYDAEGRRTSMTADGTTTHYVHDPQSMLSRLLTSTTDGVVTNYVYLKGQLLYAEIDGGLAVHHYDFRGSTLAITNGAGVVTDRFTYGAYGELMHRTGSTATPFQFHGAWGIQTDPNGLCHMRARYYSVEMRRFMNADPIGFDGGTNWYAFVGGNPTSYVDPLGLMLRFASSHLTYVEISDATNTHSGFMNSRQLTSHLANAEPGTITALTITGHANNSMLQLSDGTLLISSKDRFGNNVILNDDGEDISQLLSKSLAPEAQIYLRGCNTAGFSDGNPSIAEVFSKFTPLGGSVVGYPVIAFGIPGKNVFFGLPIEFMGQSENPSQKEY